MKIEHVINDNQRGGNLCDSDVVEKVNYYYYLYDFVLPSPEARNPSEGCIPTALLDGMKVPSMSKHASFALQLHHHRVISEYMLLGCVRSSLPKSQRSSCG
jgi:hypothetical protein